MSNPKTITIDNEVYVRQSDVKQDYSDSPVAIFIAQRGWVFVGRYEVNGESITIHNANVIRVWGTTKGLGQLVDGPTPKTILDSAGTVQLHVLGVVATIFVDGSKWGDRL